MDGVRILGTVLLSILIGMGPCLWPSSSKFSLIRIAVFTLWWIAATLDSAAEDVTFFYGDIFCV